MTQTEIATAVAAALAAMNIKPATRKARTKGANKGASKGREKLTDEQKAANARINADVAEMLFKEAGYENCEAHVTIKTYDKWVESGRRVRKGEKSLRTPKGVALFHLDQTSEIETAKSN